ncbi:MAG: PAS domain S-box protein [Cyanosarcina radialis HA8281-LM2]|jgi:PAS domain S-box-containing protein|nr:PAS domain S-box protein [Cyanosarcina radialis HA8281-LM2]
MSQHQTIKDRLRSYGAALLSVALALGATQLLLPWLYPTTTPLFLLAVMVSTWYGDWQTGLLAAVLSALAVNYFFIEPLHSLQVFNIGTLIRSIAFLTVVGSVAVLTRSQRAALQKARERLQELQVAVSRERAASAEAETAKERLEDEIGDRKLAEAALRESQERLRVAQLVAKIGAWDWDVAAGRVFWSDEYYTLYGIDRAVPSTYENWLATVLESDRAVADAAIQQALQHRQTALNFEFRICHPTEGIRWFASISQIFYDADGKPERAIGISIDITDRKQAEEALRLNEERYRLLASVLTSIVWTAGAEGAFASPQPEWEAYTGQLWEEYRGFGWVRSLHPDDRDRVLAQWLQAKERRKIYRSEGRMWHAPSSNYRYFEARGVPLFDSDGSVREWIGNITDVHDRKLAEAAARQADERFRHMADSSPVLIWQTDETGVTFVNRHYLEFFDCTFDGIKGMGWADFLHPDDAADYVGAYRTAFERQERYEFQCRFLRYDDRYRWLQNVGQPLYGLDNNFIGFVGCSVDVTDLKVAEAELQASEERFRNMADNAPMMIWVTDANGYCTYLSRSWYEFSGQTEATGLGFGWLNATHLDDREASKAIFLAANARQEAFQLEYRLCRRDGVYRTCIDAARPWFGTDGEFKGYIGSVIDIDDRIQAEAALRQSEERYRTLFESIDEGFCVVEMLFDENDKAIDYRFLEINPIFEQQTGLRQAIGKTARQLVPDLEAHWFEIYGRVALTGEPIRFENQSEPMNRWFDVYACRTGQPEERKVAIVFKDISDRKQVEVERERILQREQEAREAAENANRIKDEFLAVISHELRTPLNPILGWSQLLQRGKLNAEKTKFAIATIDRNARLQSQLIDDLLDISRILRGKLSLNIMPVDLRTTISSALETVRLAAEAKTIELTFEVINEGDKGDISSSPSPSPHLPIPPSPHPPIPPSPHPPISPSPHLHVMGDAGRLQQVVWNLLSNAVKFTPPEGHIAVKLTQADTHAQIQVIDTGKGINPEFLPYVFEHFRQEDSATTRKFGGLGLGLAIVRQIVEMHGGKVSVESQGEGQGATFTVLLPLASASVEAPADKRVSEATLDLSGIQILVVDDETDSREFVEFVLEQAGAIVTSAASAIEALQAIPASTEANSNDRSIPDLLVSDIGMPDMDGYMLLQQIRTLESTRDVPAIALTAYAGEFDRQQALKAGFQMHLAKPVEPEELVKAIDRLLRTEA